MKDYPAALERTVIFVHAPKTAGTTLDYVINRNLPPQSIYTMLGENSLRDLKNLSDAGKSQIRLVRGHAGFDLHQWTLGLDASGKRGLQRRTENDMVSLVRGTVPSANLSRHGVHR
jgi:hypothetical protein